MALPAALQLEVLPAEPVTCSWCASCHRRQRRRLTLPSSRWPCRQTSQVLGAAVPLRALCSLVCLVRSSALCCIFHHNNQRPCAPAIDHLAVAVSEGCDCWVLLQVVLQQDARDHVTRNQPALRQVRS